MFGRASCSTRRRTTSTMAKEEDEIQLVDRAAGLTTDEEEEDAEGGIVFESERRPRISGYGEEEDSEPWVDDEKHIKHPGKLKMRLRKLRSSRSKRWYWWMTLAFLTIATILIVAVPVGIWSDKPKETCFDYEDDDESSEKYPFLFMGGHREDNFYLCENGKTKLKGTLGRNRDYLTEERVDVYLYSLNAILNITRMNDNCLRMEWSGTASIKEPFLDCFVMYTDDKILPELKDVEWFGGYELHDQLWPMTDVEMNMTQFLPQDYLASYFSQYQSISAFGSVLHPMWLASNGVGILVERYTPLSVSFKQRVNREGEKEICLQSVPHNLECVPDSFEQTTLKYTICARESMVATAKYILEEHIDHPSGVPARETFEKPMWWTWPALSSSLYTDTVRNYITEIKNSGLEMSQLELGDGYGGPDSAYGDLSMGINMADLLQEFNVPLTAWVHPFVNPKCNLFGSRINDDYFLPGQSTIEGDSVSLVRWWHGYGAVIDFLDDEVAIAHKKSLEGFMTDYSLVSLSFDAGEVTYLPKCVYIQNGIDPGKFSQAYVRFAGNFSEEVTQRATVSVGYFTQQEPVWVKMSRKASDENGLRSVLTTVLTLGIAGYPFVLPDVIGGSGEDPSNPQTNAPDPVLYIRWMQLCTFLPAMHFSVSPSSVHNAHPDFTKLDIVKHALNLTKLHKSLSETFYNLSLEATTTGHPIIRPLWWIDSDATEVNDQFLIGDSMMVAPIFDTTTTDTVDRCVYFPSDTEWTRYDDKKTTSIYSYTPDGHTSDCESCEHGCKFSVPLSELLYFIKHS